MTIYRNKISSTQIARPGTGGGGIDYRTYITIGEEDCSSAFFAAQSDLVLFKNSVHFGFYNYNNNTTSNWCNWVIVLTNGKAFGEDGYVEHFVLRADAYGWGDSNYNGANITHSFVFDDQNTFNLDMNGAYVDLTLTRDGNTVNMNTVVTTASGTVYNYSFSYTGELEETLGAFLTNEASYQQIDVEDVYTEKKAAIWWVLKIAQTDSGFPSLMLIPLKVIRNIRLDLFSLTRTMVLLITGKIGF